MANVKISDLPAASTPLAGTELVPIVQSGVTSKATVDNLLNPLAETNGSSLVGYLPSGTSAVPTTVQTKLRETVSVKDFGAVGDGTTDDTGAIQTAVNSGAKAIYFPYGTYKITSTITVGGYTTLKGDGAGATVISYTGVGTAISFVSSSGSGTRIYQGGVTGLQLSTSTGAIGLDLDSVSEADFYDLIINGFTTAGVKLHSSTSGGAVYNRFYSVKSQSCGIGFNLVRDGAGTSSYTNDNTFIACRANTCTTGFVISGGNHNVIDESQIEACTTGVSITEPATASCVYNVIAVSRFESNTADISIGASVTYTILQDNTYVNGNTISDSGTRTQIIGAGPNQHLRSSGYQITGGSYRFVRTANGGTQVPHTVFSDTNSVNSPVTLEVQNVASSVDARALRVRYGGDAGTLKFGVIPISGKITDLSTTNGPVGTFTCSAAATTTISNTCVTASSLIFLQAFNASAGTLMGSTKSLFISARTDATSFAVRTADNTAAAGTETFFYWIVN